MLYCRRPLRPSTHPLSLKQLRSSSLNGHDRYKAGRPLAASRSGKWTNFIIVARDDSRFAPGGDDAYYRNDPVKYDLKVCCAARPVFMMRGDRRTRVAARTGRPARSPVTAARSGRNAVRDEFLRRAGVRDREKRVRTSGKSRTARPADASQSAHHDRASWRAAPFGPSRSTSRRQMAPPRPSRPTEPRATIIVRYTRYTRYVLTRIDQRFSNCGSPVNFRWAAEKFFQLYRF